MAKRDLALKTRLTVDDDLTPAMKRLERRAKRTFRAIGKSSIRATKSLAKIGTVGAVAAAAGIAKLTLDYAKQADELSKFSRQVKVSVEGLQELGFAAERTGMGNEILRKSLEKLNRNIGDARQGQGEMVTILKKAAPALLGELKATTSTEQAFRLMANALNEIPDAANRASLAQAVFGRAGQKVIRITEGGTGALDAYAEEARRYGLITTAQAQAAEVFVDEQENLKTALMGVRNEIGGPLLKAITPYIERLKEWVVANKSLVADKVVKFATELVDKLASTDWSLMIDGAKRFLETMGLVGESLLYIIDNLKTIGLLIPGLNLVGLSKVFDERHAFNKEAFELRQTDQMHAQRRRQMGLQPFIPGAGGSIAMPRPILQSANNAANLLNPSADVTIHFANQPAGMTVTDVKTKDGARVNMKTGPRSTGSRI